MGQIVVILQKIAKPVILSLTIDINKRTAMAMDMVIMNPTSNREINAQQKQVHHGEIEMAVKTAMVMGLQIQVVKGLSLNGELKKAQTVGKTTQLNGMTQMVMAMVTILLT